jgi:uncharacterized protein (TIGR03118 family)
MLFIAALVAKTEPRHTEPRKDVYIRHNLVSDLPGHAERLDPNLVNPWGIALSATSPFWIADNGTGVSTLYTADGKAFPAASPLVVTVPPPMGGTPPAAPTGIAFNGSTNFAVSPGNPARFIFVTEDGTVSGWNPAANPTQAILKATVPNAVYKGLAIGSNTTGTFLYATNFHSGKIDVFDTTFAKVSLSGTFTDTTLPAGFAPFGIRNIAGSLYVTYAKQDADQHDDVPGPGNGFVNVFDTNGAFVKRLISGGALNSPWGLAVAPAHFGELSGSLLVGNFGDGTIHGFDAGTGVPRGQMLIPSGRPMMIPGLWGLTFGNGGLGGDVDVLYFTAGIPGPGEIEDHGLFGQIHPQHR